MLQCEATGQYAVKATNSAGEAVCVANVVVEKEPTPPPRPPGPQYESDVETRSSTPLSRSSTSARELGPESQALRTLAKFKRHSKPLPDLLPFPFKPDERVERPRRNNTKVCKPSRFIKGEMYYSDYESDFEGNIGVKWRSAISDTEDMDPAYRKVVPSLSRGFTRERSERKPSPPGPHQWESHEDIDKLEQKLKANRNFLSAVKKYDRKEEVVTVEQSVVKTSTTSNTTSTSNEVEKDEKEERCGAEYYSAHAVVRSRSNINCGEAVPPPLPAKNKLNALTPSASMRSVDSGSFSDETSLTASSLSTVRTVCSSSSNYMKVREKVVQLERKVEEDYLKQALDSELGSIRPDRIPGAVRVLPTPTPPSSRPGSRSSSRKSSLSRSNSADYTASLARGSMFSPVNTGPVSRSVQPSPMFGRKYQDPPPPRFLPPTLQSDTPGWRSVSCRLEGERGESQVRRGETKEPTPPTQFEQPGQLSGQLRPQIDLEATVEEIKKYRNQSVTPAVPDLLCREENYQSGLSRSETSSSFVFKTTSPPPLETVNVRSEDQSRFLRLQRRSRSRDYLSEDSESHSRLERLKSPTLVMEADKCAKRPSLDGYEADTDTLKSRKGSVRNIASIFERREISAPSPVPRPASVQSHSQSQCQSRRFRTPEPSSFTTSTAYVPPRWAGEEQVRNTETKVIRINQSEVNNYQSSSNTSNTTSTSITSNTSITSRFQSMFSLSAPDPATLLEPPPTSPTVSADREGFLSPVIFQPKKFVPGASEGPSESGEDHFIQQPGEETGLPAKWIPESVSDLSNPKPEYKSVVPCLSRQIL